MLKMGAPDGAVSVHPGWRRIGEALVRALKGDAPLFVTEFRIRTRANEWKWLQGRGRVTDRDAKGRALRMSGTDPETAVQASEQLGVAINRCRPGAHTGFTVPSA